MNKTTKQPDKEGLHPQEKWYAVFKPLIQNDNSNNCTVETEKVVIAEVFGISKENAKANAELIVKAVNGYHENMRLWKEDQDTLFKAIKQNQKLTDERKALLDSNNELIGALEKIINDFLGKVKPETYNQIETAINNAKNIK